MIFKRFDYQHPPANGLLWIEFSIPEVDVDVDESGNNVGCYTGETIRKLGLVFIDNIEDNGLPFMAMPVDADLCSFDGELALIHHYALAAVPELPEECAPGSGWVEHNGSLDELSLSAGQWFWVAINNASDHGRYVTLAYHEIRDDQIVPGFDSPQHTYYPLHGLYEGDTVTHIAPLAPPSMPITVMPECVPATGKHQDSVELLTTSLMQLYATSTGMLAHVFNGMCPDAINGNSIRDQECPACIALLTADAVLKAVATPISLGKDV